MVIAEEDVKMKQISNRLERIDAGDYFQDAKANFGELAPAKEIASIRQISAKLVYPY